MAKFNKAVNAEIHRFYLMIILGEIYRKGRCSNPLRRGLFKFVSKPILMIIIIITIIFKLEIIQILILQ